MMMRRLAGSATLLALLATTSCKDEGPPPPDQETIDALTITTLPHAPSQQAEIGTTPLGLASPRDGFLYVPLSYNHAVPTPMVVLLHGASSSSAFWNNYKQVADGYGVIILAIDSRYPTWDAILTGFFEVDIDFLEEAMAFAFDRVNVDPKKISIAGFSDGASEAIGIGIANAGIFSRIMAFSPGALLTPFARGLPKIFVSHGASDETISMTNTRDFIVPSLRAKGFTVEFVVFDGGHTIPTEVRDRAFEIMIQQLD